MWTKENRARYDRSRLHYESDLSDAEWAEVEPLIPPAVSPDRICCWKSTISASTKPATSAPGTVTASIVVFSKCPSGNKLSL